MSGQSRRACRAGFTLVEMTVSLVVMLQILIAAFLVFEANRRLSQVESAVADMSAKPWMPSVDRSSNPPATTNSALPARILSKPSSTLTAVVAQAATGWTIEP